MVTVTTHRLATADGCDLWLTAALERLIQVCCFTLLWSASTTTLNCFTTDCLALGSAHTYILLLDYKAFETGSIDDFILKHLRHPLELIFESSHFVNLGDHLSDSLLTNLRLRILAILDCLAEKHVKAAEDLLLQIAQLLVKTRDVSLACLGEQV